MVSSIAHNPDLAGLPISGIGGAHTWQDVAEFMLLGASTVQVCTAIMHHGFRLVGELETGLSNYLDSKGLASVRELVGGSVERISNFGDFDLNWQVRAKVDPDSCIGCGKCIEVCRDNQVDCIDWVSGTVNIGRVAQVDQHECIGCDLCSIVCPVTDCITMEEQPRVLPELSWNGLNAKVGVPGFSDETSGITWERFPAEVAPLVDSHGFHNPSTADE